MRTPEDRVADRARVVVIGGGIAGTSVAYHLAEAGWADVLLVEKGDLTSGSTAHAAGLVTAFNPSPTMMRFRRYSIELYRRLGVFETNGSLRLASSPERLMELERGVGQAKAIGLDVELLSADETRRLLPAATHESLYGAVWMPGDGHLDPHTATHALAKAARELGATVRTHERAIAISRGTRGEVRSVTTERGQIETEAVVVAAGLWSPRVAAMAGVVVPSTPIDHQHIALRRVPGHELPRDMPCFRDPDNLVYGYAEAGGVVFGGYEGDPHARWIDGAPWDHGGSSLPPDFHRFEPLMRGAIRRFPFLEGAEAIRLVCHPDAMTPDANPLLGPVPGVPGLWLAAGLSLNGFGGAGGIGRTLADWITGGQIELDVTAYRPWRFGRHHRDPAWAAELARETYRYYYLLRFPFDHDEWGRPKRTSPLHTRLQDLGAVFVAKNGWERAERFEPGSASRRIGAEQRSFGWTRPPWLERVGEEHRAVRERAGLLDLSSFGKIDVRGQNALSLLERVATNRIDRPLGSVVYTPFLNEQGGVVADVTVTRLADDRFRIVTGSAYADADLGWLRLHAQGSVELRNVSEELAVIGLWGPSARAILADVTDDDLSDAAFPRMTARALQMANASVLAQRLSFAGELGWELYVEPAWAVQVWDTLTLAGRDHGVEPVGYRAIDSLRLEKGFRSFGTDVTANDDPYAAGLGVFVARDKAFIGRDALARRIDDDIRPTLRTLLVGDEAYTTIYGGEPVLFGDRVVSRVRSCAYGHTVRRNVALAYLPRGVDGGALSVEVFGTRVPAQLAPNVLVPTGAAGER
jgi:glycine cleavage system T protein